MVETQYAIPDINQSSNRCMKRTASPSKKKRIQKENAASSSKNSLFFPPHQTGAEETYYVMVEMYVEHYGRLKEKKLLISMPLLVMDFTMNYSVKRKKRKHKPLTWMF